MIVVTTESPTLYVEADCITLWDDEQLQKRPRITKAKTTTIQRIRRCFLIFVFADRSIILSIESLIF